ncbi:MAG: EscU/YscU/HrcU family type III secretion system export apparatus switch protein [Lachnospiraceae bacterium]|nr:EscU/YscU/HrcU family type III secretion system export apparatus switch protein [Lachnospiraceae bacterium]
MAESRGKIYGRDVVGRRQKKTAVALEYEPDVDRAPKVVAGGHGHVAERIIETAQEHDVPVHQDENLARSLAEIEIGEYIPPELYQVVAEVLLFVDSMDKIKGRWDQGLK